MLKQVQHDVEKQVQHDTQWRAQHGEEEPSSARRTDGKFGMAMKGGNQLPR